MVLVSLFVFVNGGCTSQKEQMKWIVWEGAGEKIIHVSCYVDKEEMMLEVVLQDLKGSLVSNVKSNIIYLRKGKNDVHVTTGMLHWTREVRGLFGRLGHLSKVVL